MPVLIVCRLMCCQSIAEKEGMGELPCTIAGVVDWGEGEGQFDRTKHVEHTRTQDVPFIVLALAAGALMG